MLTLAVHQFWYEKSLAVCHSQIFANFVCSTAFWSRIFKWGIYFFDLDCARSYLNTFIHTCMQVYFSILNKICDMRVTSSGCFDVECLIQKCFETACFPVLTLEGQWRRARLSRGTRWFNFKWFYATVPLHILHKYFTRALSTVMWTFV